MSKKQYPIGLDISDESLKLVQLKERKKFKLKTKKTFEIPEINCYNSIKIPKGLIVNGEIKNPNEIIKQINNILNTVKGGKLNGKKISISLPISQTFIKLIKVNEIEENKIEEKISEEVIKHFPIEPNEVYIDWQLIRKQNEYSEILVGIATKKIIDQYISILEQIPSIEPTIMELKSVAISRCLIPESKNKKTTTKPSLIIDLGKNKTSIIIGDSDTIYLTLDIPFSGNTMTNNIASSLKIKTEQAEKVKKVCGLNKDNCKGAVRELLNENINTLIDYISQATSFFHNNHPNKQIQQVLLCGGGANFIDIDKILFKYLKIPVHKSNPLLKINQNQDSKYSKLRHKKLFYTTAIGLALRDMDIE